ncbi:MAG: hypothetical protein IH940_08620 [Acidobacteria bacterium]|nr:hypothetical protein [Acidobacteriota bacterium]
MLVRGSDEPIRDFYDHSLAEAMLAPQPRFIYCIDVSGGIQARTRQFNHVRNLLPPEEAEKLRELETLYKTKLEIDAHYTLQRLLRWWLYGHVPVALMLIALVMIHVLSILYY